MCDHANLHVDAHVNRQISNKSSFSVDLMVKCKDCGQPFKFMGMKNVLSRYVPSVSEDGLEARIPIAPAVESVEQAGGQDKMP